MSTDPVMLGVTTRKITISEYMEKREGERERETERQRQNVTHGKK